MSDHELSADVPAARRGWRPTPAFWIGVVTAFPVLFVVLRVSQTVARLVPQGEGAVIVAVWVVALLVLVAATVHRTSRPYASGLLVGSVVVVVVVLLLLVNMAGSVADMLEYF